MPRSSVHFRSLHVSMVQNADIGAILGLESSVATKLGHEVFLLVVEDFGRVQGGRRTEFGADNAGELQLHFASPVASLEALLGRLVVGNHFLHLLFRVR
jgi:hypothetical protein